MISFIIDVRCARWNYKAGDMTFGVSINWGKDEQIEFNRQC